MGMAQCHERGTTLGFLSKFYILFYMTMCDSPLINYYFHPLLFFSQNKHLIKCLCITKCHILMNSWCGDARLQMYLLARNWKPVLTRSRSTDAVFPEYRWPVPRNFKGCYLFYLFMSNQMEFIQWCTDSISYVYREICFMLYFFFWLNPSNFNAWVVAWCQSHHFWYRNNLYHKCWLCKFCDFCLDS